MVLVHLLPTAGGVFLSFKNLNTFTFSQLFGAPWAGLDELPTSILFDADNPLHTRVHRRRSGTPPSTRSGPWPARSAAGSRSRCCSTGRCAASKVVAHADADAVDRAELRRRGAVAVHVAERRRDRQQGPRRLHAAARRPPGVAARRQLDVGDHHPEHLARPAVRDADLPRRPAGDPAGAPRGGRDRRRRPVAALPPHHAAAAAPADRRPAAVRRHLRRPTSSRSRT